MKPSRHLIALLSFLALTAPSLLAAEAQTSSQTSFKVNNADLGLMPCEWGQSRKNVSTSDKPLSIRGNKVEGIGTHARSEMILELNGKADTFTATVGVDDNSPGEASVIFRLKGDDKVIYDSGLLTEKSEPKDIKVSLKGIKRLTMEVDPATNGNKNDHAVWGDPTITMIDDSMPMAIPDCETVVLETDALTLGFSVSKTGDLFFQYLGPKTTLGGIFQGGKKNDLAYPTIQSNSEVQSWKEPALHVLHADGHQSTVLHYQGMTTEDLGEGSKLTKISLKDPNYPFYVTLCFKLHGKENVIEQWSEITHNEPEAVELLNFASAALTFHNDKYNLTQFSGGWANEFNITESELTPGSKVIENKWGIQNSCEYQQHFMISFDGVPEENKGRTLAATLAWSGNYKMQFEMQPNRTLTVTAGMNPWASQYTLKPGETFTTPPLVYTYSPNGKGEASRNFHRWARHHVLQHPNAELRVLFNNWEATGMDTSDKRIVPFFKPAKDLGFELFLLDDGWFGLPDHARVLGEWDASPIPHPKGMSVLIEEAGKAGIDFGLWVEMEMANPDARLVKEHPEWLLCEPDRPKYLQRGQYVLDLANPEVQDFCINAFKKILKDNPGIDFVKWDCNSAFHNPYSAYLGKKQSHLWIDYTHGLYRVFDESFKEFPHLQRMLCAGGGARSDYGSLKYFSNVWASDNTSPWSRIFIQWGYSHVFPARAVCAHVTHWGNMPFKLGFDVAMSGCLGMDADPTKMTDEEKRVTERAVAVYKEKLRPVVQFGDLYRLISPLNSSPNASLMYVSEDKDKAAVFYYRMSDPQGNVSVTLEGLDPDATYLVEEVNIDSPDKALCIENGQKIDGKTLMAKGLNFKNPKKQDSASLYLVKTTK